MPNPSRSPQYVANVVSARLSDEDLVVVDAHFVGAVDVNRERRLRMVITVLEGVANIKHVRKRRSISFSCTVDIARGLALALVEACDKPPDDPTWIDITPGGEEPDPDDDLRFERDREDRAWPDS